MQSPTDPDGRTDPHASRPAFIDTLVADLRPVRAPWPLPRIVVLWSLIASTWVISGLALTGPVRTSALADFGFLRLQLEVAIAALAILTAFCGGLELGVPGADGARRTCALALGLFGAWVAILLSGEWLSGPPLSMLGKRPHCLIEGLGLALGPIALGLWFLRGRLVRGHAAAGALVGAAAAALPAVGMQFGCMYVPEHALRFHLSPVLIFAVIGAAAARFILADD
jgi:hypothetical protein